MDENTILIDPVNVGGFEETDEFFAEIRKDGSDAFREAWHERRSMLPDPQLIFELIAGASASWFAVRVANAAGKALEPKIVAFFDAMYAAIHKSVSRLNPNTRPSTYIMKVHGDPFLQFLVESRDPQFAVDAFADQSLMAPQPTIENAKTNFNAEMLQFISEPNGEWRLKYMVSANGQTLGSYKTFERRGAMIAFSRTYYGTNT